MSATLPPGRYSAAPVGPRRRGPRTLTILGALVGAAVAAVVVVQTTGGEELDSEQIAFELVDDTSVRIRFDVTRGEPERAAVCIVRARSLDGSETGRREVYVPPDAEDVTTVVVVVRTSEPPVASNVFGCSYTVPVYLQP